MNENKKRLLAGGLLVFLFALSLSFNQIFKNSKFNYKNKAAEVSPTPTVPPYVKGEILVGINPNTLNTPTTQNFFSQSLPESGNTLPSELSFLRDKAKVKEFTDLAAPAHKVQNKSANFQNVAPESKEPDLMYKLVFDENTDIQSIISDLKKDSRVTFAEPNYVISIDKVANDPDFNKLWNLQNTGQNGGKIGSDIKATQAWDTSTDAPSQIIAVIDTGIDYNHLDLLPNIYTNQNEKGSGKENNGVDDDGNGFIDDYHGWNFINNTNNAQDDNGHGTHVSGTIAAVGNNSLGSTGIIWHTNILPLKFLNAQGSGEVANAVQAIYYATAMGAKVANNSWGSGAYSQALYNAIEYAGSQGMIFVAAAGNNAANTDYSPNYPSKYNLPNIISVASTTNSDQLSYFSNYGLNTVHIAAPGSYIYSTYTGNTYKTLSGTSMATPHVVAAIALLQQKHPDYPLPLIKDVLMDTTDTLDNLNPLIQSGGRLNLNTALTSTDTFLYSPKSITRVLSKDQSYTRKIKLTNTTSNPLNWTAYVNVAWAKIDNASGVINPLSSSDLSVTLSTNGLKADSYTGYLNINQNNSTKRIPLNLSRTPIYVSSWNNTITSPNGSVSIGSVKDTKGNIYTAGYFRNSATIGSTVLTASGSDMNGFLVKYATGGQIQWIKQIKGFADISSITVDQNDVVYLGGINRLSVEIDSSKLLNNDQNTLQTFIASIDTKGTVLSLIPVGNEINYPTIAVRHDGGYYVTGLKTGSAPYEYLLVSFDKNGNEQWGKSVKQINTMIVDSNDNVITTGVTPFTKYDNTGTVLVERGSDIVKYFSSGNSLTLDKEQNIIEAASLFDGATVIKFDPSGTLLWNVKYTADNYGRAFAKSVTVDDFNNIVTAGTFDIGLYAQNWGVINGTNQAALDIYYSIIKPDGTVLYLDNFGNNIYQHDVSSVLVDASQNIYLTGTFDTYMYIKDSVISGPQGKNIYIAKLKLDQPYPTFNTPENPGKALYFKPADYFDRSMVKIPNSNQKIKMTSQFTFEGWIKTEMNPHNYAGQSIIYIPSADNSNTRFELWENPDDISKYLYTKFQVSLGSSSYRLKKDPPMGKWFHFAVTRDGTVMKTYINGELIQQDTLNSSDAIPAAPSDTVYLGREVLPTNDNMDFQGSIDEIRLSSTVRNIEDEWTKGSYFKPLASDSSTIALWHFDNNYNDSSDANQGGTASGTVKFVDGIVPVLFTPTPTNTPTPTPSNTPTPSPTNTPTPTPMPPIIKINSPVDNKLYITGSSLMANYVCSDPQNLPLTSCTGTVPNNSAISTTSVGQKTFTVNAANSAGKTASQSLNYVVGYTVSYLSPMVAPPRVNNVYTPAYGTAYTTVKWGLINAANQNVTSTGVVTAAKYTAMTCGAATPAWSDTYKSAAGYSTSNPRYDSYQKAWLFNWQLPTPKGCYALYLKLNSSQVVTMLYKLN